MPVLRVQGRRSPESARSRGPALRSCLWLLSLLGVASGPLLAAVAPAASGVTPPPSRTVRLELARGATLLRRQMARLPEGSGVVLEHASDRLVLRIPASLLFAPDAVTLRPGHDTATILSMIAQPLMRRPRLAAQVLVYTDSIGGSSLNDSASTARAQAVAAALVARGVPDMRLEVRGAGASAALARNDSPAGRMRNRRVEIAFEYAKALRPAQAAGHAGG